MSVDGVYMSGDRRALEPIYDALRESVNQGSVALVAVTGARDTGRSWLLRHASELLVAMRPEMLRITANAREDRARGDVLPGLSGLLRSRFELGEGAPVAAWTDRVRRSLEGRVEPAQAATVAGDFATVAAGGTPAAERDVRRHVFGALGNLLRADAERRPVTVALANLHLAPAAIQEGLAELLRRLSRSPALVLVSSDSPPELGGAATRVLGLVEWDVVSGVRLLHRLLPEEHPYDDVSLAAVVTRAAGRPGRIAGVVDALETGVAGEWSAAFATFHGARLAAAEPVLRAALGSTAALGATAPAEAMDAVLDAGGETPARRWESVLAGPSPTQRRLAREGFLDVCPAPPGTRDLGPWQRFADPALWGLASNALDAAGRETARRRATAWWCGRLREWSHPAAGASAADELTRAGWAQLREGAVMDSEGSADRALSAALAGRERAGAAEASGLAALAALLRGDRATEARSLDLGERLAAEKPVLSLVRAISVALGGGPSAFEAAARHADAAGELASARTLRGWLGARAAGTEGALPDGVLGPLWMRLLGAALQPANRTSDELKAALEEARALDLAPLVTLLRTRIARRAARAADPSWGRDAAVVAQREAAAQGSAWLRAEALAAEAVCCVALGPNVDPQVTALLIREGRRLYDEMGDRYGLGELPSV